MPLSLSLCPFYLWKEAEDTGGQGRRRRLAAQRSLIACSLN